MRIAFYLDAVNTLVDYAKPEVCNPGIGGAQFLIWTTSYYFKQSYPEYDVFLIAGEEINTAESVGFLKIDQPKDIALTCVKNQINILVMRGPYIRPDIIKEIDAYSVKCIVWSHNFENYRTIKNMCESPNVIANICVSNEQLDLLRDTKLYAKSAAIYNGMDFSTLKIAAQKAVPKRICYIGNLYPGSGYETMLKAWLSVRNRVPDAELMIIGGNDLYNKNTMLQEYSAASVSRLARLEKQALFRADNTLDPRVRKTGVLRGEEKLRMMATAAVGVANMTKRGDTFGLGLVEFEALGVPVVSIAKYGVRETVRNEKSGLLAENPGKVADAICEVLSGNSSCCSWKYTQDCFLVRNFGMDTVVRKWDALLQNPMKYTQSKENRDNLFTYDGKQAILINAKFQEMTLLQWLPSIQLYKYIGYAFSRLFIKLQRIMKKN